MVENKSEAIQAKREDVRKVLEAFLKNLLSFPEKSELSMIVSEKTTIFEIDICPEDFGKIIGGGGKTISALRTLAVAMCANNGYRGIIRIKDEDRFFGIRKSS